MEIFKKIEQKGTAALPSWLRNLVEEVGVPPETAFHVVLIVASLLAVALTAIGAVELQKHADRKVERQFAKLGQARDVQSIRRQMDSGLAEQVRPLALLRLARAYYLGEDYARASATYAQLLEEHADAPLVREMAGMGQIVCLESQRRTPDALSKYEEFIATYPDSFLVPEAMFGRARCMVQLGQPQEARQALEDFLVNNPDSAWKKRVEQELETVNRQLKRLAGTL